MKTQRSFIKCQQNVLNVFSLFQRLTSTICFLHCNIMFQYLNLGFVSQMFRNTLESVTTQPFFMVSHDCLLQSFLTCKQKACVDVGYCYISKLKRTSLFRLYQFLHLTTSINIIINQCEIILSYHRIVFSSINHVVYYSQVV